MGTVIKEFGNDAKITNRFSCAVEENPYGIMNALLPRYHG
jgi:hypothetical protein